MDSRRVPESGTPPSSGTAAGFFDDIKQLLSALNFE